jgi:hypothetical protein
VFQSGQLEHRCLGGIAQQHRDVAAFACCRFRRVGIQCHYNHRAAGGAEAVNDLVFGAAKAADDNMVAQPKSKKIREGPAPRLAQATTPSTTVTQIMVDEVTELRAVFSDRAQ